MISPSGLTSSKIILFLYVKIIMAQWGDDSLITECKLWTTTTGVFWANCITDYFLDTKSSYYKINEDLPVALQAVDFSPRNEAAYSGILLEPNMFKLYSQLRRIIMRKNIQFIRDAKNDNQKKYLQSALSQAFKELHSLEYLEINGCALEDWFVVRLPTHLKSLNFDNNRYHKLDVHWAEDLEELSAKNNSLDNVPKITGASPPIRIMRLNMNPLKNMTIVDIAYLCELATFELSFSPNSHFVSKEGYCQCVLMKRWAQDTDIEGLGKVDCFNKGDKPDCPDEDKIWKDAKQIHKKCPLLRKGAISSAILKTLKYLFLVLVLGLVLALLILYVIRHFHLKEFWAAHHAKMAQEASSFKSEDDEEEPMDSSEKSTDSSIEG